MLCGISECKDQIDLRDSAVHYARFHQKFTCDICKEVYFGVVNFKTHPSIKCIPVVTIVAANKASNNPKKSQTRNQKILQWLLRLNEEELDPSSTFSSLEVSTTPEICKKKVRYHSIEEAILALIKMEKRKGGLIQQLPYRCNHCKGVHNTHLISRRRLNDLISKYKNLSSKS